MKLAAAKPQLGLGAVLAGFAALSAFAYLALTEVASIVDEIPIAGATYSPTGVYGFPQSYSARTAFTAWASIPCTQASGAPVARLLSWYNAFDLLFIVGYAGLLYAANVRWRLRIGAVTAVLVAADLAEDVLTYAAIGRLQHKGPSGGCVVHHAHSHDVLFGAMSLMTWIKWSAAGLVVLIVGYRLLFADGAPARGAACRTIVQALNVQKFPLIVLTALCGLLLISGSPILDQGIDVERSWFLTSDDGRGWGSALVALLAFAALAGLLRYVAAVHIGGLRIGQGRQQPPQQHASAERGARTWLARVLSAYRAGWAGQRRLRRTYLVWLAMAGVVVAIAVVLSLTRWARIDWRLITVTVAVLATVPLLSLALCALAAPTQPAIATAQVRLTAWRIGRLITYATFCVLPLSVSRAYVSPLVLGYRSTTENLALVLLSGVAAVVVLAFGARRAQPKFLHDAPDSDTLHLNGRRRLIHPQAVGAAVSDQGGGAAVSEQAAGWLVSLGPSLVVALGLGTLLVLFPVGIAEFAGVIGTFAIVFVAFLACYAVLVIGAQMSRTPYVFTLLRMRMAPVVSLTLVIALISTFVASSSQLHDIRGPRSGRVGARVSLANAFAQWQANWAASTCPSVVAGSGPAAVHVRPMIFVAAEGGGIRAALWTVDAMSALTSSTCGRNSVFVASGVSGGAVGLAVMDTSTAPRKAIDTMAGEQALAVGVEGLLTRDLVAGVFGVDAATLHTSGKDRYPDRAALIEQAWERDAQSATRSRSSVSLASPFPLAQPLVGWRTVFNSTSVAHSCRALISDIDFGDHAKSCTDPTDPIPGAYDLLGRNACYTGLATSTAALLAARFPYVTPSGVTRTCTKKSAGSFDDQLIDGGYAENTGIDTDDAILAQLLPTIQQTNAAALRERSGTLIVPIVLFLHNGLTGTGPDTVTASAEPEVLVPPAANSSSGDVLGAKQTLLQRAAALTSAVFPAGAVGVSEMQRRLAAAFPTRTMTIAPQLQPQVALPLGWAASQETIDSMQQELKAYLACPANATRHTDPCTAAAPFVLLRSYLGGS